MARSAASLVKNDTYPYLPAGQPQTEGTHVEFAAQGAVQLQLLCKLSLQNDCPADVLPKALQRLQTELC